MLNRHVCAELGRMKQDEDIGVVWTGLNSYDWLWVLVDIKKVMLFNVISVKAAYEWVLCW